MKKTILLYCLLFLSLSSQSQISKVKFHVDRAKNSAVQMKSYLDGMTRGSKDSRNIYASRLRSKVSIVKNHLEDARAKIPSYKNPKFKQKGFTSTKTHSFTNRMYNAMLNIRNEAGLYRESTKNASASRHMNSIISSYNRFLNAYREFTKYAREAYKIELVVEVDERTKRNQKDNKDQTDWIRKVNNYDDNKPKPKPKPKITKKPTTTIVTRTDILKRMNILRKNMGSDYSIKFQNRLFTMISRNAWWNFPIDDVDFSKSEIELNQKKNLYYFWVRTTNGSRKIKTSWNSPSYRAISIGTSFKSKSEAVEFKALLKRLATRNYKNVNKKPVNINQSTSKILNRMNVLQKKYNPKFSVKLEDGLFKGHFRPTSYYKFDLNDIDFSKSHYKYDSDDKSHNLMFYTKNEKRKIITTWGSPLYRVFTSFSNKEDALEFKALAKQLASKKKQKTKNYTLLSKSEIISQLKNLVSSKSFFKGCSLKVTGNRIKLSYNKNEGWKIFNVKDLDFNAGGTEKIETNEYRARFYTKDKVKSVVMDTGGLTNQASWLFQSKEAADKYRSLLKQLSNM